MTALRFQLHAPKNGKTAKKKKNRKETERDNIKVIAFRQQNNARTSVKSS